MQTRQGGLIFHRFVKPLIVMSLLGLILSACQPSDSIQATSVTTITFTPSSSTPNVPTATSVLSATITPDLMPADSQSTPTTISAPVSTITATAVIITVPTPDLRTSGLLVFDQHTESIGRLSFDGRNFHPLDQVPKLNPATLEYGLVTDVSGYFISPDGDWLTTIAGFDQLVLVNTVTDQRNDVAQIGAGAWLGWAPDSRSFAYREGESKVCIYRLVEQTADCINEFEGRVVAAAWSPHGDKLALSVAGELEEELPGIVNGAIWVVDVASRQTQLLGTQDLPLGSVSASDLLMWTTQGLIINRSPNDTATLFSEGNSTLLAANAVSASPSGNYVVYEDGRIEQVSDERHLNPIPLCPELPTQIIRVVWSPDESRFAYTVYCAIDDTIQLGVVDLANQGLSWNRTISDHLRLLGWSHEGDYLFFRHEPADQQQGYKVARTAIDPNGTFETVADSTFLIGILGSGSDE